MQSKILNLICQKNKLFFYVASTDGHSFQSQEALPLPSLSTIPLFCKSLQGMPWQDRGQTPRAWKSPPVVLVKETPKVTQNTRTHRCVHTCMHVHAHVCISIRTCALPLVIDPQVGRLWASGGDRPFGIYTS